jgi:uncharacterized protein YggE
MTRTALTVSGFVALLATTPCFAAPADTPAPRTLSVTGQGIAKAAPDEANFSTGVVAQGATAAQALAANSHAMNAVFATLKRQGIPDKAIQTSNLSLSPQYQQCKPNVACPQKIVGYEVSNTVSVTVSLDKTGPVLDALVASGSNQIGGISFAIHDPKPLLEQARGEAVKDAFARAQLYAKAAGVSLGPILAIQEGGSAVPQPMFKAMAMRAESIGSFPAVAGGEEAVSANVSITWALN